MKHHIFINLSIFCLFVLSSINAQTLKLSDIKIKHSNCHDSLDGSIKFNVLNGIPPYTYLWNNGKKTASLERIKGGKYTVTVSDNSIPKVHAIESFEVNSPKKMELYWHYDCFSSKDHLLVVDSLASDVVFPIKINRFPAFGASGPMLHTINPNFCRMYPDSGDCKFYPSRYIYEAVFRPYDSLTLKLLSYNNGNYCEAEYKFKKPTYATPKFSVAIDPDTLYIPKNKNVEVTVKFETFNTLQLQPLKSVLWYRIDGSDPNIEFGEYKKGRVKGGCYLCDSLNISENKPSIYRLRIQNIFSCIRTSDVYVIAKDEIVEDYIPAYLPTAFSPNDDGVNDYFTAFSGGEVTRLLSMEIFDRWGNQLYEVKDIEPNVEYLGWNGKQRGIDVPQGNYSYAIRLLLKNGTEKIAKGEVMLLR